MAGPFFLEMPNRLHHRLRVAAACAVAILGLAGCGIVSQVKSGKTVSLRVTDNFGSRTIGTGALPKLTGTAGALSLTRKFFKTTLSSHGVSSIDGLRASGLTRWTLYVNGIDSPGPNPEIYDGDHIWWDLHNKQASSDVPAIVGQYPEPFINGTGGRVFPTVVTCASGLTTACNEVSKDLDRVGVKVSYQGLGTGSGSDSLALLIGTYAQLRGVIATELLGKGPSESGVYAQFYGSLGKVLQIENAAGQTVRNLVGSYGLIAATEEVGFSEPVWLVTGTDKAGVNAAAKALTPANLANHFAVAVSRTGKIIPLPTS